MSWSRVLAQAGALERRSPLPVGRYWVDVPRDRFEAFNRWLSMHATAVKVQATEARTDPMDEPFGPGEIPPVTWFLFRVLQPVAWEGPGFPSIATDDVHSAEDTADRPDPEPDVAERFRMELPSSRTISLSLLALGAVAVFVLLGRSR